MLQMSIPPDTAALGHLYVAQTEQRLRSLNGADFEHQDVGVVSEGFRDIGLKGDVTQCM